jgi:hypothetical protein
MAPAGRRPVPSAGFAWFADDRVYRRLPLHPPAPLPSAVDQLANATAGGQIRFRTDSTQVAVRVRLAGAANMPHMPATGQCGFDAYLGGPGGQRYYLTTKHDPARLDYEFLLCDLERGPSYELTLNFPLYQGVEALEVGLEPGAMVMPPAPTTRTGASLSMALRSPRAVAPRGRACATRTSSAGGSTWSLSTWAFPGTAKASRRWPAPWRRSPAPVSSCSTTRRTSRGLTSCATLCRSSSASCAPPIPPPPS